MRHNRLGVAGIPLSILPFRHFQRRKGELSSHVLVLFLFILCFVQKRGLVTLAQATLFDMALPEQLQAINQITEALCSEERRTLLYLCGALDPDDSVSGMREMLTRKVMQHDEGGHLLLRELMVKLRRFDILRRVFKSSKEEVERTRPHTPLLPGFRYAVFFKHTCAGSRSEYPGDLCVNLFLYCLQSINGGFK